MNKKIALIALVPMLASAYPNEVSFDMLHVDIDFIGEVHCEIQPLDFDFGKIEQGKEYTVLSSLSGSCSNDIRVMVYPLDKGDVLSGSLNGSLDYKLELNVIDKDTLRDNRTASACGDGTLANVDESGCHFRIDTGSTGAFTTYVEATLVVTGSELTSPVDVVKTIPMEVMATYEK